MVIAAEVLGDRGIGNSWDHCRAARIEQRFCRDARGRAPPLSAASSSAEVVFTGMCDASGAGPLSAHTFAVADDEANVLRVYDADRGGSPLYERDISAAIGIPARPRKDQPGANPPPPPFRASGCSMHQLILLPEAIAACIFLRHRSSRSCRSSAACDEISW